MQRVLLETLGYPAKSNSDLRRMKKVLEDILIE